jgi:LysM repeat protein
VKRVALATLVFLGITATAGLAVAQAAAPAVTIISPDPGITVTSDAMDVVVTYEAPAGALTARVELVVDGAVAQSIALDPPERSGTLSLTWEAGSCLEGEHLLAVRAVDTGGGAGGSQIAVLLHRGLPEVAERPRITRPAAGATVAGVTSFEVESAATQVKYVIFLVDNVFKAMSNIRPFSYSWDTAQYLNGTHQLQAKAYLADGTEALSRMVEVQVDNPSGMTTMRSATPADPQPAAAPARTAEPSLPPAIRTESATPYSRAAAMTEAEFGPPGTAPYVSETGDLIQPPTSPLAVRTETARPPQTGGPSATEGHAPAAPQVASTSVSPPPEPAGPPAISPAAAPAATPVASVQTPLAPPEAVAVAAVNGLAPAGIPAQAVTLPKLPPSVAVPAPRQVAALPAKLARDGLGAGDAVPQVSEPGDPVQPLVTPPAAASAAAPATSIPAPTEASAPTVRSLEAPPSAPVSSARQLAMLPPKLAEASSKSALYQQATTAAGAYIVQSGDSLWTIAARHGLTVAQLAEANDLTESAAVRPGQQLRVPAPSVYVDGSPLLSDVPVSIADGRMLAPFRAVVEQAGGTVAWEPSTRQARSDARGKEIAVTIGSDVATVDGRPMPMGAAAVVRGNRALVPLRFLGEALDMVLHYRDGVVRMAEGK